MVAVVVLRVGVNEDDSVLSDTFCEGKVVAAASTLVFVSDTSCGRDALLFTATVLVALAAVLPAIVEPISDVVVFRTGVVDTPFPQMQQCSSGCLYFAPSVHSCPGLTLPSAHHLCAYVAHPRPCPLLNSIVSTQVVFDVGAAMFGVAVVEFVVAAVVYAVCACVRARACVCVCVCVWWW